MMSYEELAEELGRLSGSSILSKQSRSACSLAILSIDQHAYEASHALYEAVQRAREEQVLKHNMAVAKRGLRGKVIHPQTPH